MGTRVGDWFDQRSGWRIGWARFFLQRVPQLSWSHLLGAATLTSVLVLTLTGILMTIYYSPTPEGAHASVEYITNGVRFGWFVRGLHHWAASALVVFSVAHMVRVVLQGAYKYPREFTWISGVALLLITFAFGLTGSLLPWDQRAFWATAVRIRIFGSIPVIGDELVALIQGGDEISVLTLSRFYAAHTWLLPIFLFLLVVLHIRLVVRHGLSGLPKDGPR